MFNCLITNHVNDIISQRQTLALTQTTRKSISYTKLLK